MYIYIYIYTHIYTYIHTYMHAYTHIIHSYPTYVMVLSVLVARNVQLGGRPEDVGDAWDRAGLPQPHFQNFQTCVEYVS